MSKLSYEEKIEIYNKRKAGETLNTLHSKYGITEHNIQYLVRLIDRHGFDILKHTKNKYYPPYQKEQIINRVLLNIIIIFIFRKKVFIIILINLMLKIEIIFYLILVVF